MLMSITKTDGMPRVLHKAAVEIAGAYAEEITNQTQTEELTEQTAGGSSRTATNTECTKPETKHKPPLSEAAILARREYDRQYRARNRDKINARQRKWHKEHPEKQKQYNATYWNKAGAALAAGEEC